MKLYVAPRVPNPRRVQVFLAEKGITIPEVIVDLAARENFGAPFLALNPSGNVPVLQLDDGAIICESVAICRYFEALQPEPNLFGRTPLEQGMVEMWQRQVEIGLLHPVQFAFRHLHPVMAGREIPQVAQWGEANKDKALAFLSQLDQRLANSAYIALERFTIADITALVAIDFMRLARLSVPDELVHLARWRTEVSARPASKAGM